MILPIYRNMQEENRELRRANVRLRTLLEQGLEFWPDEDGENLAEWRTKVRSELENPKC